jgi:segregation and condensation protein A
MLATSPEGGPLSRFLPSLAAAAADRPLRARAAVASTLMAGLELARTGEADLEQPADFATITVRAGTAADQRRDRRLPPAPDAA